MFSSVWIGALLAAALFSQTHPISEQDASEASTLMMPNAAVEIGLVQTLDGQFTINVDLGAPIQLSGESRARRLPFLLDTGANLTALPRHVAAQLTSGERLAPALTGHALTSEFPTSRFWIDTIDFGTGPRRIEAVILPERSSGEPSFAGVLGLNAFSDRTITLDLPGSRLLVGESGPVDAHMRLDPTIGLIRGRARVAGFRRPVNVYLDTGVNASIINSAFARALQSSRRRDERWVIYDVSGAPPDRSDHRRFVDALELGEVCLDRSWISVADLHAFEAQGWADEPAMIIGLDVLQHTRITVDPVTRAVSLEAITAFRCGRRRV